MTKCVSFLVLLCLVSSLGIVFSNPFSNHDEKIPLQSVQLTQAQATALCNSVTKSQINNYQLYQWIKVQKQPSEESQQVQQQQKETEKKNEQCFKIGFIPCLGKPRFPFKKDCGFFTLMGSNEDECSSSSVRSKRSISTRSMSISMGHGEALHLCHTIQTSFPNSPEQINYVAVKIQARNPNPTNETTQIEIQNPSENCITWVYTPCLSEKQENCDGWHKKVKSIEECTGFHSNDPADHPKNPQTSALDPKLHREFSSSSLLEIEQVIRCKSIGSSPRIQCEILPVGTQTEISTEDKHSRQKRHFGCLHQCCCFYGGCECCCSPAFYNYFNDPSCGLCCPIWTCNGQG